VNKILKIAFFSVIYPGVEKYIDSFFLSLIGQDYTKFDVIIFNDGFNNIREYVNKYHSLNITIIPYQNTQAKIRERGIEHVVSSGYDAIIFGDADDYFKENRISETIFLLNNYEIVINDIDIVSESCECIFKEYFSNNLKNLQEIILEYILDKNCFGLSNTAVKTSVLKKINLPSDLLSVDWYLFSKLLLEGSNAIFTNTTTTFYRQHNENFIGMNKTNEKNILRQVDVKCIHYKHMKKIDDCYEPLSFDFNKLQSKLKEDKKFREYYIRIVNNPSKLHTLWHENIKSLKSLKAID
jgi:hypothetical protein